MGYSIDLSGRVALVTGASSGLGTQFAKTLAANAPLSLSGAKYLLNGIAMGTGALDLGRAEAMIAAAAGSDDYREGRAAFAGKRAPKFQGR